MERTWIRDPEEWRRGREQLRNVDRYELSDAVSQGRAVKRPELARFVLLEAERQRSRGTRVVIALTGLVGVVAVVAAWLAAGEPRAWVSGFVLATSVALGSAAVFLVRRSADRAVARNAAVLEGVLPQEADETIQSRGAGAARRAGSWIMAAFIVSVLLRASSGLVGGLLVAAGVEVTGLFAVLAGIVFVVLFVLGTVEMQRIISRDRGLGRGGGGSTSLE